MEGSRTHLNSELQAPGSGNLPLPTSYKCSNHLAHISTCKTSTRTSILEHGIKSYRDLKEGENSRFAGAQGAEVRKEGGLRVLNSQGRGSKRSPAFPNGRGRSPQGSATRRGAPPACAARCRTGKSGLCTVNCQNASLCRRPIQLNACSSRRFD